MILGLQLDWDGEYCMESVDTRVQESCVHYRCWIAIKSTFHSIDTICVTHEPLKGKFESLLASNSEKQLLKLMFEEQRNEPRER